MLKTPPASFLIRKAAGVAKGSGTPNSKKVGSISAAQLKVRPPPTSGLPPLTCSSQGSDVQTLEERAVAVKFRAALLSFPGSALAMQRSVSFSNGSADV